MFHVMERAGALGVENVVVTHPCYDPPGLDAGDLRKLAGAGAYVELSYVLVDMGVVSFADTAAVFRQVGADRVVLSTDLGQVDRVSPAEGLGRLAAGLMAEGVPREDVETAMKRNPRRLMAR